MRQRIAIFGGSFDPPHKAHLDLLNRVQSLYQFNQIQIIPSKYPIGKMAVASYEKRLAWCRQIFNEPYFVINNMEKGSQTTVFGSEIVSKIVLDNPQAKYYWILGSDQLRQLAFWKDIDAYAPQLEWVMMPRERSFAKAYGIRSKRLVKKTCTYHVADIEPMPEISSTKIRENLHAYKEWIPEQIRTEVVETYQQRMKE